MAESNEKEITTNPPPEKAALFPYDAVVGIVPDTDHACDTVEQLTARGFEESEITLLAGEKGIEAVDLHGKRHGLLGRIFKKIDRLGSEHDESLAHVRALRDGNLVLGVRVDDDEEKERARQVFEQNEGQHVSYYSRWTSEQLIP